MRSKTLTPWRCSASWHEKLGTHEVVNYKRFKALIAEWIDLSIEQCRLKMQSGNET